jgi:hypothetical protein
MLLALNIFTPLLMVPLYFIARETGRRRELRRVFELLNKEIERLEAIGRMNLIQGLIRAGRLILGD